ncbi:hypothetical protein FQA47_014442 [Oryzias melastigma]|uniref:Uncharacterized protein n=1 Tax=Oryzias melastigma TaxID=30732 RepID=A0A834C9U6_ORYME|nr:hypothetical protein FQA47_014442 [Oryzias melastigma]
MQSLESLVKTTGDQCKRAPNGSQENTMARSEGQGAFQDRDAVKASVIDLFPLPVFFSDLSPAVFSNHSCLFAHEFYFFVPL